MKRITALAAAACLSAVAMGQAASIPLPSSPAPAAQAAPRPGAAPSGTPSAAAVEGSPAALPRGFRGIELGMGREEVTALLAVDNLFYYRGDPDVSLLDRPDETLVEVSGLSYVKRAFFQFKEDKLFVMIFSLNEAKIDHYSVYTAMTAKYGKPASFSPGEIVWSDSSVRVSVERPLSVKYVDVPAWEKLVAGGDAKASYEETFRKDFLDGF